MKKIKVGMIGLGNVGTGVARYFHEGHGELYNIHLTKVAVRDDGKERDVVPPSITTDPYDILHDPNINIVIEVMGGTDRATDYMLDAMKKGKHVVTANKASIAENMPILFKTARENGVNFFFEGSVAGSIPFMRILRGYQGEDIYAFTGIINGTCNYVLSAMERGNEYADALATARNKGIAEADPTLDVGGFDARDKLVIIIAMVHNTYVPPEAVYTEGITDITRIDVDFAEKYEIEEGGPGYRIKLLAQARRRGRMLEAHVYPAFVSNDDPLALVSDTVNAIHIEGAFCGPQTYIGKGAGQNPTASAVLSDVREVAQNIRNEVVIELPRLDANTPLADMRDLERRGYLRFDLSHTPGSGGEAMAILGKHNINIEDSRQRKAFRKTTESGIVIPDIMTFEPIRDGYVQDALRELRQSVRIHEEPFHMRFA